MKHYKSVEVLSNFQNIRSPLHKRKPPYWKLSGHGSGRVSYTSKHVDGYSCSNAYNE